jgi:CMP-N,N'-diacetyllegionaminic acid synthase
MLAIIPARKGSKGLKNKNLKILFGKPLICWTIEALLNSKKISKVIVSTNDARVVKACKRYNIMVPVLRPEYLSQDDSLAIDVYKYEMNIYNENKNKKVNDFLVALPTSPLRTYNDINKAINKYQIKKPESLISCTKLSHPSNWALRLKKNMYIDYKKISKYNKLNRQSFVEEYVPNGAIYILKLSNLIKYKSYYTPKTLAYIMPKEFSVDIDDINDFNYAEFIMSRNKKYFNL